MGARRLAPTVENADYARFLGRILRAMARRASSDIDALPMLLAAVEEVDELMAEAVARCRAEGYSWTDIGARLGISRQAAQQRFGVKAGLTPVD
jgi:DNA-directed RNA polymerase specialized sigma24 family protein